nr:GNAT family N-acetyltransferase [Anaerolineae bacterium]NIN94701.1 GNAT family N-acetyltransferase [Anaerolineae bacterium]NIQ77763.1 GNAT family N-acetyltransferase [Anaerolineae bacterium]
MTWGQDQIVDNIEVCFRDRFSTHGEELVRSRIGTGVMQSPMTWPQVISYTENWRDDQTLVMKVDGVVAGRAVLGAATYPFAELENLEVMPAFRRRGAASRLVAEAVRRASDMGFPIMHLQTFLNNKEAHAL